MDETRPDSAGIPKSPTKRTFSFTMPLSPSLDSGISSPDDYQRGRFFEFPVTGEQEGSGSGSDGDFGDFDHSLDAENGYIPHYGSGQECFNNATTSPDPFQELDVLSSISSDSPTKSVIDDFSPEVRSVQELFSQMQLDKSPQGAPMRVSSCHRLPVFDDMLNTKSDSALLELSPDHSTKNCSY